MRDFDRGARRIGNSFRRNCFCAAIGALDSHALELRACFETKLLRRRPAKTDGAEFQEKPREFLQAGGATHLVQFTPAI